MFCLQAKIYLKSIDESEVAALTSAVSTSMPSPSARDKDTGATNTSNDDAGGIKSPTMAKPGGLSVAGGVGIQIARDEERGGGEHRSATADATGEHRERDIPRAAHPRRRRVGVRGGQGAQPQTRGRSRSRSRVDSGVDDDEVQGEREREREREGWEGRRGRRRRGVRGGVPGRHDAVHVRLTREPIRRPRLRQGGSGGTLIFLFPHGQFD